MVVSGTSLLIKLNSTWGTAADHEQIKNLDELQETFSHFFRHGLPGERYMADRNLFETSIRVAEHELFGSEVDHLVSVAL